MDEYVTDHMVDLTPAQIAGLKKKTEDLDPKIVQVNVAEANIVDRCESCHMGAREPVKLTAAAMTAKGAKTPDDYAKAFVSHPTRRSLQVHDPDKFGCSPCHQGNGRATTSVEKAHGNYEHWLWPLYPQAEFRSGLPDLPRGRHDAGCDESAGPSARARIYSGSVAAWDAIATRATTRNQKNCIPQPADQANREARRERTPSSRLT